MCSHYKRYISDKTDGCESGFLPQLTLMLVTCSFVIKEKEKVSCAISGCYFSLSFSCHLRLLLFLVLLSISSSLSPPHPYRIV